MGIDPVTHSPRLDLLELSSLLSSTLYNPQSSQNQLHLQNLLGNMGPLMNQNLLNLVTTLLSYQPKSTSANSTSTGFVSQNVQEISPLNHVPQSQFQSFQTSSTSNTSTVPYSMSETQFIQAKMDPFSQSLTHGTSCPNNFESNMWQNSVGDEALFSPCPEGFVANMASTNGYPDCVTQSSSILNSTSENQAFVSCNVQNSMTNMSFTSLLSTPSCSPNTLNSSLKTYVNSNSSPEDNQRDSFCSNMFMYDIANYGLNGNEFL